MTLTLTTPDTRRVPATVSVKDLPAPSPALPHHTDLGRLARAVTGALAGTVPARHRILTQSLHPNIAELLVDAAGTAPHLADHQLTCLRSAARPHLLMVTAILSGQHSAAALTLDLAPRPSGSWWITTAALL